MPPKPYVDPLAGLRLWACETCNTSVLSDYQERHLASKFHEDNIRALSLKQQRAPTPDMAVSTIPEDDGGVGLELQGDVEPTTWMNLTTDGTTPAPEDIGACEEGPEDCSQSRTSEKMLDTDVTISTETPGSKALEEDSEDDIPQWVSKKWPTLTPNVTTSNVTTPNVMTPNVITPSVTAPNVTTTSFTTASFTTASFTTANVTSPNFTAPNVTTPAPPKEEQPVKPDPRLGMPSWAKKQWREFTPAAMLAVPPQKETVVEQEATPDVQLWKMDQWRNLTLNAATSAPPQVNKAVAQEAAFDLNPWATEHWQSPPPNTMIPEPVKEDETAEEEPAPELQPWTCTICKFTLTIGSRESHEAGRRHLKKVETLARLTRTAMNLPATTEPSGLSPAAIELWAQLVPQGDNSTTKLTTSTNELAGPPESVADSEHTMASTVERWECKVCNITIAAKSREAHEAGKRHSAKSHHLPWECTICNVKFPLGCRPSHEAGKQHRENLSLQEGASVRPAPRARPERVPNPTPTIGGTWTCTVCNVMMDAESRTSHEAEGSHRRAVSKPFECKICGVNVHPSTRAAHEAGNMHQGNLKNLEDSRKAAERPPPYSETTPANIWTCQICDVRVHPNVREKHEAGRPHQAIAKALEDARRTVRERAPAPVRAPAPTPIRAPAPTPIRALAPPVRAPAPTPVRALAATLTRAPAPTPIRAAPPVRAPAPESAPVTPSTVKIWTCPICNVRLHPNNREKHEAGKAHQAAVGVIDDARRAAAAMRVAPSPATSAPPVVWTCVVCDVRLHANIRAAHEAGKKHRANVELLAEQQQAARALPRIKVETWTCTACDKTLPVTSRELHEESIDHKINVITSRSYSRNTTETFQIPPTALTPPSTAPTYNPTADSGSEAPNVTEEDTRPRWMCEVCNLSISAAARLSHELGKRHAKALAALARGTRTVRAEPTPSRDVQPDANAQLGWFRLESWTCNVCNVTIAAVSKEPHEASKQHMERLWDA